MGPGLSNDASTLPSPETFEAQLWWSHMVWGNWPIMPSPAGEVGLETRPPGPDRGHTAALSQPSRDSPRLQILRSLWASAASEHLRAHGSRAEKGDLARDGGGNTQMSRTLGQPSNGCRDQIPTPRIYKYAHANVNLVFKTKMISWYTFHFIISFFSFNILAKFNLSRFSCLLRIVFSS